MPEGVPGQQVQRRLLQPTVQEPVQCLQAVSYTHLDVYKRQVMGLPPFLPDQVIAQHVGQLHDLLVADGFPLELGRQVGNAVRDVYKRQRIPT